MPIEYLPISSIDTSDRQRKYFAEGDLIDLAEGIEQHELLHAPVLLGDTFTLIAGERRLRAMEALHARGKEFSYLGEPVPSGMAPVVRAKGRDTLALREAELAENLLRVDLSWQERSQAECQLHELRALQKGKQTLRETAKELYPEYSAPPSGKIAESLLLSKHLDDPDIAKTKNRKDALRKAQRKELAANRARVRESLQIDMAKPLSSPHLLLAGDFRDALREADIAEGSIDLLLTDPPYGVDASDFSSQFTIAHTYNDSQEEWEELMQDLAELSYRLCKPQAHAFVFCDIRRWYALHDIFTFHNWDVWPRPLIWDKGSLGALSRPKHGPRFCYETILFALKGNKEILKTGRDVLNFPTPPKTGHGAEKPVELFAELIDRTCEPGGLILDPFAGSGTIFPAATSQGCKAIGVEIVEEYIDLCRERLYA